MLRMKLRTKVALIVGGIIAVTGGTAAIVHVRGLTAELQEVLQVKPLFLGRGLAGDIAKLLDLGRDLKDIEDLSQRCRTLGADDDLAHAMVVDSSGAVLCHNDPEQVGLKVSGELLVDAAEPEAVTQSAINLPGGRIYNTLIPLRDKRGQYRGAVMIALKGEVVSRRVTKQVRAVMIIGGLSFVIMILAITLFINRKISRPLVRLADTSAAAAEGDLAQKIETDARDEIGELYTAFNSMLKNLRELQGRVAASFSRLEQAVGDVTDLSSSLQSGSEKQSLSVDEISTIVEKMNEKTREVTTNMQRLSKTSEETSSSTMEMMASIEEVALSSESLSTAVNQTSSSMEQVLASNKGVDKNIESLNALIANTASAVTEIDASIKQVESLSQESRLLSEEVTEKAQNEGNAAVAETISEMHKIRDAVTTLSATASKLGSSVGNIGEILTVIDDVADQTNLLALNAAIIAAQAGEHGLGFAVVAEEIRELAERTSSSTKEIAKVITGIQTETKNVGALVQEGVGRVDRGVAAVGRTDEALKSIISSTEKAAEMSSRIALATREQASGSRDVSRSVHEVSQRASEISRATTEQSHGSEFILQAIENMREMAEQVRKATVEQSTGAKLIARAGEGSSSLAQEVSRSSQAGREMSERVLDEVGNIRAGTREALTVVTRMNEIVEQFGTLAQNLKSTLSQFHT